MADYNANGVPDECEPACNTQNGVDLNDYVGFASCLGGPNSGLAAGCGCPDFDIDGDVDLLDFAEFQVLFDPAAP